MFFNPATGKSISTKLVTSAPDFWRPTDAISQPAKDLALAKTKAAFEAGKLFSDADMQIIECLDIRLVCHFVHSDSPSPFVYGMTGTLIQSSNMSHVSPGDPNPHYSVQGKNAEDIQVKHGHVTSDESKQTVSQASLQSLYVVT